MSVAQEFLLLDGSMSVILGDLGHERIGSFLELHLSCVTQGSKKHSCFVSILIGLRNQEGVCKLLWNVSLSDHLLITRQLAPGHLIVLRTRSLQETFDYFAPAQRL